MEIDDMWDDDEDMSEFKTSSATTHDRDKVIAAAKEAGISYSGTMPEIFDNQDMLAKFYAIAFEDGRQAEREDCAKVCEALAAEFRDKLGEDDSLFLSSLECADAIRARGDMK